MSKRANVARNVAARPIAFLRAPAVDGEVALVSLIGIGVVLIAGLLWQKELRGTLVVAGAAGLAIRALLDPWSWHLTWRGLLGLLVAVVVAMAVGLSAGIVAAVGTHDWKAAPVLEPARGARPEILLSPCPSPGEQISRLPDGSYVCSVPIPPDPGTGPVLASPPK